MPSPRPVSFMPGRSRSPNHKAIRSGMVMVLRPQTAGPSRIRPSAFGGGVPSNPVSATTATAPPMLSPRR